MATEDPRDIRIRQLETENAALQEQLSAANRQNTELSIRIRQLETEYAALQEQLNAANRQNLAYIVLFQNSMTLPVHPPSYNWEAIQAAAGRSNPGFDVNIRPFGVTRADVWDDPFAFFQILLNLSLIHI